jgi:predicted dehydrogenase
MKQIVQPVGGGPPEVLDVPCPVPGPAEVLVRTVASVISPGTERAVTALAQASLLAKARARPDLVRQVARKTRAEGFAATSRVVRGRLAGDVPLGYSAAGIVVEAGPAVTGIRPGQLVATGGAGNANHAEFQVVPGLLCAAVPDRVPAHDAAFATVSAIALHALRLAEAGPGSKVAVIGLGLIGQLAARLAMAAGCEVAGIDPAAHARQRAGECGVFAVDESGEETTRAVLAWSRGRGADAVLVCAADPSSRPVLRAPALCRDRATVVVVGDTGLDLRRAPFYEREISLRFARSYGPGRYELSYEGWGVDYPAGQVRWTEGRNLEAVLDLLAAQRLSVSDLVTHSFGISEAAAAYRLIEERSEPYLAIRLTYPASASPGSCVRLRPAGPPRALRQGSGAPAVGWVGAGAFSTGTLLPAFRAAGFDRFVTLASAGGLSARRVAERHSFEKAASGAYAVIDDPDVDVVVIAAAHDAHGDLAVRALAAGKHVWCEKPLALTADSLDAIEKAWRESGRQLAAGFNRRWSPAVLAARAVLAQAAAPKLVVYRVAAGRVPDGHWYRDRRQGGRLLGEVCHFIDTAQALVGADIEQAIGVSGGEPGALPGEDAAVALRFADGSLAVIGYGSAEPAAGKERVEILAGARRVVIDDWRHAEADGRTLWKGRQDKGHRAAAAAFYRAVAGCAAERGATGRGGPEGSSRGLDRGHDERDGVPTEAMLAVMRATIEAAGQAGRAR